MMRILLLLGLLISMGTQAQESQPALDLPGETVVVFNPDYAQSRELAEYYAEKRGIPKDRLIGLALPIEDSISREQYDKLIRKPLFETFVRRGWWKLAQAEVTDPETSQPKQAMLVGESGVRVVCLMRGVPFQIRREQEKPITSKEDEASVDSELCTLGMPRATLAGAVRNPYFDQAVRFQMYQGAPGMLLVGRLDAPDADTVKRMIDDALHAEEVGLRGRAVIDLALKTGAYQEGEDWLTRSAILFREHGVPVFIDKEEPLIADHWPLPDTAFYFGWYTATVSGAVGSPSFKFMPGAIACHLHSFSAAAVRSPDRHWVGPLLKQGAAVALGNVFEPYLSLTVHFDVLNRRLLEGYTVAEAAWCATPVLSWMNVVCGDPLYRPYARGPVEQPGRRFGQRAALALAERHVGGKGLAAHALAGVHQAVAAAVDIGVVDLRGIADEHQLGAARHAGDDGLGLQRGELLGLVEHKEAVRDGASADVAERLDLDDPLLDERFVGGGASWAEVCRAGSGSSCAAGPAGCRPGA
jgi:uncharacterized protein (TIGR03790 family)